MSETAATYKIRKGDKSLSLHIKDWKPPVFLGGAEYYTSGDVKQFFYGLLAAKLIEENPSLILKLQTQLTKFEIEFSGISLLKEILGGADPINKLLCVLRSRGGDGQIVRSDFPWLVIAEEETWENARKFSRQLTSKGWGKLSDLGGNELSQRD